MKTNRIHFHFAATFAVALFIGVMTMANGQTTNTDPLIPAIRLEDVPIKSGIDALARHAGINYLIDPKLFPKQEPAVNISWTNISAKDALERLLKENGLAMVEDRFTTIAQITSSNHVPDVVDTSLLGSETNSADQMTNAPSPIIKFEDVPLNAALEALIKYGRMNVIVDPKVSDHSVLHDYIIFSVTDDNETTISIYWENISARQAIVALCENYDLVIVKDSATGVVNIKPKN